MPRLHDDLLHRSLQLACTCPIRPSSALNISQNCLSRCPIEYIQGVSWVSSVFVETQLKHLAFGTLLACVAHCIYIFPFLHAAGLKWPLGRVDISMTPNALLCVNHTGDNGSGINCNTLASYWACGLEILIDWGS